jgi:hypothetical protein
LTYLGPLSRGHTGGSAEPRHRSDWLVPSVDIWHDRAVFHFLVTPEDRARYRARLGQALKVRGTAIVATFAPDGPEKCSGLPIARYSPESLAAELGEEFQLFRETAAAVGDAEREGILAVEMESAALYAFARAQGKAVLCFAHVTNTMGQSEREFEKGHDEGVTESLRLIASLVGIRTRS